MEENVPRIAREPAPQGPVATQHFELFREGVQECEARIYIEDALVNKKLAQRSPDLAKRCQAELDERLCYMWKALDDMQFGGWGVTAWRFQAGVSGHAWLQNTPTRERSEKLYLLAGEVEKALAR